MAGLTFVGAASAATPEAPETGAASAVTATTATLSGVLDPKAKAAVEPGTYEFLYRVSETECAGSAAAPSPPEIALGMPQEAVSVDLTGLEPNRYYSYCLLARNAAEEATVGSVATFVTPAAPPTVDAESVVASATGAMLEAQVNPNNQETTYLFEYSAKATGGVLEAPITKIADAGTLPAEYGDRTASVATGAVLAPGTTYFYRVVAENQQSKKEKAPVKGAVQSFTTPPAPHTDAATAVTATTATLNGHLTLSSTAASYSFDYNLGGECTGGSSTPVEDAGTGSGSAPESASVSELEPTAQYSVCFVTSNAFGSEVGAPVTFTTSAHAPVVEGESFSEVGAHSAAVTAMVNMENQEGSYHYVYGTVAELAANEPKTTASQSLASSASPVVASAQLAELQSGTEYHFRLVVENGRGETAEAAEETFRTLTPSTGLPDGRVFEEVTPVNNHDAEIYAPWASSAQFGDGQSEGFASTAPFQAAVDGNAVVYNGGPTTGNDAGHNERNGVEYIARRRPQGGWEQVNISTPDIIKPSGPEYQGFSNDLSIGVLPFPTQGLPIESAPPLSADAPSGSYKVLYAHATTSGGAYDPLFSTTPLNLSAEAFGSTGEDVLFGFTNGRAYDPVFAGGSADFSHLVFEANDALIAGEGKVERELDADAKRESEEGDNKDYLYEWTGGRLALIDVLPDGTVAPNAMFGGPPENRLKRVDESSSSLPDFGNVISEDGSRVFWTDLNTGVVYAREDGVRTVQLSAGPARYWTASTDGRYVLYTEGEALYRFDTEGATREELAGAGAGVAGVVGVSSDGSYVYFAAAGALAAGAFPQECLPIVEPGQVTGGCNLYVWHDGVTRFIHKLSSQDGVSVEPTAHMANPGEEFGDWEPAPGDRTAEVTPDGHNLVFMSDEALTSYPNTDVEEVYAYNFESDQVLCVSCNPSGTPPSPEVGGAAAFLPLSWSNKYLPSWMSEDGDRVFFDGDEALVPEASDNRQNVYEWEREGTGSCRTGSAVNGGCVYLLSGGTSESDSWLVGESPSGNDVFMVTRARLTPEDENETFDVYDARVGGVEPTAPTTCTGTGCQGTPAAPPTFATPATATYSGLGNFPPPTPSPPPAIKGKAKPPTRTQKLASALKTCRKKRVKKTRIACEAQARKRYGAKTKKPAKGRQ
jgi:hypothetical protein